MSRKIDMDGELSEDDIRYLRDRCMLPEGYNSETSEEAAEGPEQSDQDNSGSEDESAEDESADYESLSVDELKTILSERGLPVSGNKSELIERIVEDDEWEDED